VRDRLQFRARSSIFWVKSRGFFLLALVTHGGWQQWWIEPVLSSLSEWPLMIGATLLTALNDNAAITI
jgi:hypothetical protein